MAFGRFLQLFKNALTDKAKKSVRSQGYCPRLEVLEDRRVPSRFGFDQLAPYLRGADLRSALSSGMNAIESFSNAFAIAETNHHTESFDGCEHRSEASEDFSATNLNQTKTYTAGATSVALDPIVVSAEDSDATFTATLTLANTAAGSLTATSGNGETYNSTTGVWTITGSLTKVNAALAAVAFAPSAGNSANTTVAVKISKTSDDGGGDCGRDNNEDSESLTGTINLNVSTTSSGPTATNLNQTKTYSTGAASVALDPIVVSDTDSSATITATLTLANTAAGSLTASTGNGETYNSSTGVWTVTGSLTKVNAALAAVSFVPTSTNTADTTIAVKIRDTANAGPDGSIALNVTTTSSGPTATNLNQTKSFTAADTSVALDPIVVSDPDSSATITAILRLANTAAGSLSASSGNGESYNSSTGVWTVTGSLTSVNAALAAVTFLPNVDSPASTTIAAQIRDSANAGPNGTITLTLSASSNAARTTSSQAQTSSTNSDSDDDNTGDGQTNPVSATNLKQTKTFAAGAASVALNAIVVSDTNSNATIRATLELEDPTVGSLTAKSGNGETYDSSTGVWTVTGSVTSVNAALAAVAFVPSSNSVDTSIEVRIRDLSSSSTTDDCEESLNSAEGRITLNTTGSTSASSSLLTPSTLRHERWWWGS
jgi:hypothetical protein